MAKPSRVIAVEEHYSTADFPPINVPAMYDIGERRIETMDRFGIDMQVLSLAAPGVHGIKDASEAVAKAKRANDVLAELSQRFPTRFTGFAILPTQDPAAAADELERSVKELKLKGGFVNGHTLGHYLDERQFDPIWERAEAFDVPIYLHPSMGFTPWELVDGYPELARAAWGWSAETGAHALRVITGGTFDRFPGARMILGHMGESIPLYLYRIDSRMRDNFKKRGLKLNKPSDYVKSNVLITTSGVFSDAPLVCAMKDLGGYSSIMFSVDHPYENDAAASEWLAGLPLPEAEVEAIAHGNAERLLKIDPLPVGK